MEPDPEQIPEAAAFIAKLKAQQQEPQPEQSPVIPPAPDTTSAAVVAETVDSKAPYGRKKDGKPKRKPGRKRKYPIGKRANRAQRRAAKTGRDPKTSLDPVIPSPKGSKTNIAGPSNDPRLRDKAPYSMFGQIALDELTALSPSQSLKFFAEKLVPSSRSSSVQTYEQWITSELPEIFTISLGPHQIWPCENLRAVPYGARLAIASPRGSGKTKFLFQGLPLAAIAMGSHQLIILVGSTQTEASSRLNDIRSLLNRRPDLAEKYPRLRYVMAPRSAKRYKTDTNIEIELEGGKIIAVGAESKIRGIGRDLASGESLRPDLVLVDDFETTEQVRSRLRTERLEEWIFAEVCQLGTNRKPVSVILGGTTLGADAVLVHALKKQGRFESWMTKAFPIISTDQDGTERRMWPEYYSWESIRALLNPKSNLYVGPFCVTEDTEALTQKGWKKHHELNKGDRILAIDKYGKHVWSIVEDVHTFNYKGPMYRLKSRQMDCLVTPGHRFVLTDGSKVPVEKLGQRDIIQLMGEPVDDGAEVLSDAFVELLGWYTTEGSLCKDRYANTYRVRISQNRGPGCDRIRSVIKECGGDWVESPKGKKQQSFEIRGSLALSLARYAVGPRKVLDVALLSEISARQRTILIETIVDGDGWRINTNKRYTSITRQVTQKDLQWTRAFVALCAMNGISTYATLRRWKKGQAFGKKPAAYVITLRKVKTQVVARLQNQIRRGPGRHNSLPQEDFAGLVWCPKTSHGTWVCRTNGIVHVTGNTFSREFLLNPTDVVGAIWTESDIAQARLDLREGEKLPEFKRVVVAIDPSWGTTRDECGIIVAALGIDNTCYILNDLSGRMAPADWGKTAAQAYVDNRANQLIAEAVFGAEDVKMVMENTTPRVPLTPVTTTIRKRNRFEEIYKLFKQQKIRLVGSHPLLEHQMGDWVEDQSQYSPDRLDAMCYACAHLLLRPSIKPARVRTASQVLELVAGQGGDRVVLGRARVR